MKHVKGRVLVEVDLQGKNWHTFNDGTKIRLEREYNNLDVRETKNTLGIVISAEDIPTGAMLLFHPNATHDVNRVFNTEVLSGKEKTDSVKIYSMPETDCFLWKMPGEEWQPLKGYVIAERVYAPYEGLLEGIEPKQLKNVLFIKTGELKGFAVHTLKASDYLLIFNNEQGVEQQIIRCRHYEKGSGDREEIVAKDNLITEKIKLGKLLIGSSPSNAKQYDRNTIQSSAV